MAKVETFLVELKAQNESLEAETVNQAMSDLVRHLVENGVIRLKKERIVDDEYSFKYSAYIRAVRATID